MQKFGIPGIIGHRGARGQAPENTFAAFRKAKELGATWVEFDVQATKDQVLVIAHDEELDRTTNGTGRIVDPNWNEIKDLDAGSWFNPVFAKERIPTFADTIDLLGNLCLGANVEIKPYENDVPLAKAVAKMIAQKWPKNIPSPLVSSFSIPALEAARNANPDLLIGVLFETLPSDWKDIAKRLGAKTINIDQEVITPAMIQEITQENYPVLAYTVNDIQREKTLFSLGVTAIFKDFVVDI